MRAIHNPYEFLLNEVSELKKLLIEIKNKPKEDFTLKYYTRKEAALLLRTTTQTIKSYIEKGWIKKENVGPRKQLIHHYQIFNEDNSIKEFKYKREL